MTPAEIKALRLSLGYNQTLFAVRMGVSVTTISHWETGQHIPDFRHMRKLLRLQDREAKKEVTTP